MSLVSEPDCNNYCNHRLQEFLFVVHGSNLVNLVLKYSHADIAMIDMLV